MYIPGTNPMPLFCSRLKIPDTLRLLGSVELQATADGQAVKFNLLANTGKPMPLEDYPHPVIIDLKGAKFDQPVTPIIMEHDPERRVGHTLSQEVNLQAGSITAVGIRSSATEFAEKFEHDLKSNFPFQVSVGGKIMKAQFVPAGQQVKVNGRIFDGPVIVSRRTNIRELSVCVMGADNGTSVSLAATDQQSYIFTEEVSMEFEAFVKSMGLELQTLDDATVGKIKAMWESKFKTRPPLPTKKTKKQPKGDDNDPLRKQRILAARESQRIDTINAVASRYPVTLVIKQGDKEIPLSKFKARAISKGMKSNDFELTLLRAHRPKHKGKRQVHMVPGVEDLGNEVVSCAVLKAMGNVPFRTKTKDSDNPHLEKEEWGLETWYDDKVLEASDHRLLRSVSLHQVMDMMIHQQLGYQFTGRRGSVEHIQCARKAYRKLKSDGEIRAAGYTTLDISTIFEDVGNKLLWSGYNTIATVWEQIVTVVSVSDFKTYNFYRMDNGGAYQKVGNDGELKHGKFTEEKFSVSAETYGKLVGLTRKDMINDDLGVFNRVMSGLGSEAARTIEEIVFVHFLGQLATLFPVAGTYSNYLSGAGYLLSVGTAALAAAETLFINQVNADKSPIGINPDRILVGSNNKTIANNLYNQTVLVPTGTTNQRVFPNNEYVGTYRPIITPYINNTAIKQRVDDKNVGQAITGQTSTGWWMLAPPNLPQGGLLLLALLNGRRRPFLDQAEAAFDTLGMLWRAYHDVGIANGDPKLGVYVTGA